MFKRKQYHVSMQCIQDIVFFEIGFEFIEKTKVNNSKDL